MKISISVFAFLMFSFSGIKQLTAQELIPFGTATADDLLQQYCEIDSSADAMILWEVSVFNSHINSGYLEYWQHVQRRIKIFSDGGLDQANIELRCIKDIQTFKKIRVAVTKKDGNVKFYDKVKVNKTVSKDVQIYSFAIPDVQPGDVIEYEYTKITGEDYVRRTEFWFFQHDIPTRQSFSYFPFLRCYAIFDWGMQPIITEGVGIAEFDVKGSKLFINAHDYKMMNIPAFREDKFSYPTRDRARVFYVRLNGFNSVSYNGTNNWNEKAELLRTYEGFGGVMQTQQVLDITNAIHSKTLAKNNDTLACIQAVYDTLTRNFKHTGDYGLLTSQDAQKIIAQRSANGTGLNLTMIAMFNALNIPAYPVITATRDYSRIQTNIATLVTFNHTIAAVEIGEEIILLDATEPQNPFRLPSLNVLNDEGLLILKDGTKWVSLEPSPADITFNITGNISPDGSIVGAAAVELEGYPALEIHKSQTQAEYITKPSNVEVQNNLSKFNENKDNLVINFDYQQSPLTEQNGDNLYLTLPVFSQFARTNLPPTKRTYPLDFGFARTETTITTLTLPSGYRFETATDTTFALPKSKGYFRLSHTIEGDNIIIKTTLQLDTPYFSIAEYDALIKFFSAIGSKLDEPLILRKI